MLMPTSAAPRIWIELDDLIRYFDHHATPTGIGRVQLEIVPQLLRLFPEQVGIIRIGKTADDVQVVPAETLSGLLDTGDVLERRDAARPVVSHLAAFAHVVHRRIRAWKDRLIVAERRRQAFRSAVRPGDLILALGGSWTHSNFGQSLRALKARHGIRFAILIHDILPVTHPEFVSRGHLPNFVRWFNDMMLTWDIVLTPSKSVAQSLRDHLGAIGSPIPPIVPIPFGFGFTASTPAQSAPDRIDPEPYALFVSTIEIRKNHLLLYRVWERLIARHGKEAVPRLILAGSNGWGVDAFRRAMSESDGLGGKIRILSHLTDPQMQRAYDDCLFTVFPSLCEGWGLPVGESLFHGRLCIASNATSIPEIGGDAVDYFDPHDEDAALAAVERALFEPGYLQEREAWIAEHFESRTWEATALALHTVLTGNTAREDAADDALADATGASAR